SGHTYGAPGRYTVTLTVTDTNNPPQSGTATQQVRILRPEGPGVFDPTTATWYLRSRNNPGAPDVGQFAYGAPGWIPLVGDWDGNGVTTAGVFDPATATWYLRNSNTAGSPDVTPFQYGGPGWRPVVGDWDGDGKWSLG